MSYIRSVSNPEGLYIFGTDESIDCSVIVDGKLKVQMIPIDVWHNAWKRWLDYDYDHRYHEIVCHDGFCIFEVPHPKDPRHMSVMGLLDECLDVVPSFDGKDDWLKMCIAYKDWHILMWKVTFWAIEDGVASHQEEDKIDKRWYNRLKYWLWDLEEEWDNWRKNRKKNNE